MVEWIYLLLNAVDITSDIATSYLKEFVTPSVHVVTSKYSKHIIQKVWIVVQQKFTCGAVFVRKICYWAHIG